MAIQTRAIRSVSFTLCHVAIDIYGSKPIYLSMEQELPEERKIYSQNQIRNMGTHTLFELYRNEINQKTKEELKGNTLFIAIEHEIEKRLREYEHD